MRRNRIIKLKMKFKKQTITIGILIVLLIVAGGYIGMIKYNEWRSEKELGLFQQGAQYGYLKNKQGCF